MGKNWIKGLMDISLLTANANQLRQAFEQCEPFRTLLVVLLSISIVTQVVATCILIFDHYEARRNKFAVCRRCRAAIAFTMVIIVVVNIVVLSLWAPTKSFLLVIFKRLSYVSCSTGLYSSFICENV